MFTPPPTPAPPNALTDAPTDAPPVPAPPTRKNRLADLTAPAVLIALFLAIALPLILTANMQGRGAMDQINYHEKVVRTFAASWPRADFRDYLSATTPGYHWLLAGAGRLVWSSPEQISITGLRLLAATFTLGLLTTLGFLLSRTANARRAIVFSLPLLCSLYTVQSGAWLLPDNAAWWMVLLVMILAARLASTPARPASVLILGGLTLLALVWFRQIHIWAAGLLWAGAWLGVTLPKTAESGRASALLSLRDLFPRPPGDAWPAAFTRAGLAFLCTLPAWATLVYFYDLWGGSLVPPTFLGWYKPGLQPATAAFVLTQLALASVFFGGPLLGPLLTLARTRPRTLALAAGLGLGLALVGSTDPNFEAGRFSGIWYGARMLPVLGERVSVFFLLGAPAGAVALVGWLSVMPRPTRWILFLALVGFASAQTFSVQLWQRYHEPMILMWTAWAAALAVRAGEDRGLSGDFETPRCPMRAVPAVWATAGPLVLAGLLAFVSVRSIGGARAVVDEGFEPGKIEPPPGTVPSGGLGGVGWK